MNLYSVLYNFYKHFISKALRYAPRVIRGSHSFTCHPHTNQACLYSSAAWHKISGNHFHLLHPKN